MWSRTSSRRSEKPPGSRFPHRPDPLKVPGCVDIVGPQFHGLLEVGNGLVELPPVGQRQAQIVVGAAA